MQSIDVIVAGAGIWGCTIARQFADAGKRVLVLEKRNVIGGNVRCEDDPETGIEVHTYGSHIFHTHLPAVWKFVNRFTSFNGYQHKVLASYKGRTYFLPLGLTLVNKFFGTELKPSELSNFMADESKARAIFDAFFRGYTSKQWGKSPEAIDPSIIRRVPVRSNYDINYFNDYNQGIPSDGYNAFFTRLLDHENISVVCDVTLKLAKTGKSFKAAKGDGSLDDLPKVPVFYSGPIDALFEYRFGALPWRTLRFERESLSIADFQGTSVVNYTEVEIPYTRIHEFKHYHPERTSVMTAPQTIIMREYSAAWRSGDEPYYPIDTPESRALLKRYQAEVRTFGNQLIVGGRLGGYCYFDMDRSVEAALTTVATRL